MRVLLSSVFGPYGVDDAYGRKENIMELFHNQITREQGVFSVRVFHQSFGLYFIAENIEPPTLVLDFPTQERFIEEIQKGYDYVGISFIVPNYAKAKHMAELVRKHSPGSKIVLGGHGVKIPVVKDTVPHDHLCEGEGVRWFRSLLGEDPDRSIRHPVVRASFGGRIMGMPVKDGNAHLCPGVGCPNACRFCCTSHFFHKKYTPYLETGKDVFDTCLRIEKELGLTEFFVMDENFLIQRERALELMDLMEKNNKFFQFGLFSSADNVVALGPEFLARLGVTKIWIGAESRFEVYEKNKGLDLKKLLRSLRDHGISVIASAILFLEQHDKETIWEDIQFAVDLESDFLQFMQLGPLPGTQLYEDYDRKGILRTDLPFEEWHGQHRIWFRHPHFTGQESQQFLKQAFLYDYDQWGPSVVRMCDTLIRGYRTLKESCDHFMTRRAEEMRKRAENMRVFLEAALAHAHNDRAREITQVVMEKYEETLGAMTKRQRRLAEVARKIADRESLRLKEGKTVYQPKTIETAYRMVSETTPVVPVSAT